MAATRLLRMSKPLGIFLCNEKMSISRPSALVCLAKVGTSSENQRKPVAAKAVTGCSSTGLLISEPKTERKGVDLKLLLAYVVENMSRWRQSVMKVRPWRFSVQMLVEKAIIDCRFFALLATAGSLLGSVLCFVEGCFMILESYFQYFHSLSQMSEQGHVVLLLIEAIDMFLVGTAMLVFGMALHVMFVGQDHFNPQFQKLPSWIGVESAVQAKSKIGHAVIMILQVQVLEKLKSIPVTNGMDLACFAGSIFMSSASIFLLSRIAVARVEASSFEIAGASN